MNSLQGRNFHIYIGGVKYSFKKEAVKDLEVKDGMFIVRETVGDEWYFTIDKIEILKAW